MDFKQKILAFVEAMSRIWFGHIIPVLYLVSMWSFLTIAVALVLGDFIKAAGIVSALALTNILRIRMAIEYGGG